MAVYFDFFFGANKSGSPLIVLLRHSLKWHHEIRPSTNLTIKFSIAVEEYNINIIFFDGINGTLKPATDFLVHGLHMDINFVALFDVISPGLMLGCEVNKLFLGHAEVLLVQITLGLETLDHLSDQLCAISFRLEFTNENSEECVK